jgi:hypothetical protein
MKIKFFSAVILALLSIVSCKKDTAPRDSTSEPDVALPLIAIKLNTSYVTRSKVDSALILWEVDGQTRTARMQMSNDTLYALTKDFRKGAGRLTVQVFSSVKLRNEPLQFERRMEVTLKEKQSIHLAAPESYDDAEWNPRVILMDEDTKLTAIIALRPTDSYFLLKNIPAGFKIELERLYTRIPGGAEIVAGATWKCNTVCTDAKGVIENREFFRSLATQIAGREWKMVQTGVGLFGPNGTSGGVLFFNHF